MGLFNNEEIEQLQAQIKKLQAKNKELSKALSDQQSQFEQSAKLTKKELYQIKEEIDITMKPREEYLKWEKMKDKLPDIEEMYDLKKLKYFVAVLPKLKSLELTQQDRYSTCLPGDVWTNDDKHMWHHRIKITTREINEAESEIRRILEKLRKHRKNKELVGLFKLYAISTDWLKPQ